MKFDDKLKAKIDTYFDHISADELFTKLTEEYGLEDLDDVTQKYDYSINSDFRNILSQEFEYYSLPQLDQYEKHSEAQGPLIDKISEFDQDCNISLAA